MTKEELISRIINDVISISKKYDHTFVFSLFPYSLIVDSDCISLLNDLTNEKRVLENKSKTNSSSTVFDMYNEIISTVERYQGEYSKISLEDIAPYLDGELMTYSNYCPLKYQVFTKESTLDRNESGVWIITKDNQIQKIEVQEALGHEKLDKEKEVLVFFSGGRDSMLACCRLIRQGYYVSMISFDNGHEVGMDNIKDTANRIIFRYGKNKCRYLGNYYMGDLNKTLKYYFDNTSLKKIYEELGDIDFNQIQCMTCRSAMYIAGIIISQIYGINYIAEGARKCQLFAIEQPSMIEEYKKLLARYNIELLLPVYNLESDWQRRTELQDNGFLPKTLESVCMLGLPMERELTSEELATHVSAYQKKILPSINKSLDVLLRKY